MSNSRLIYNYSLAQLNRFPSVAAIGTCIYIATFAIPFKFRLDIQLFVLALFAFLTIIWNIRNKTISIFPLSNSVLFFLVITALSVILSKDAGRSMQLSVSLLPAVLIFFLIAGCFHGTKDVRLLYFVFSIVVLGMAAGLLWDVWTHKDLGPSAWVSNLGSTIFIVKNDVSFFSVITPFLLSLIWLKPRSLTGAVAVLALILSLAVVGVFQSRVAMLSMVISVICFFSLLRLRIGLACGLFTLISILAIDSFMGFPLIERFIRFWDGTGRIPLWLSAWEMFLDKPFLGHGPHTFVLFYNSYLQELSIPSWLFVDRHVVPWPHNLYLEVLAEQGIIGIAALVSLFAGGLSKAWGLRKAASSEMRILGYGAFAGLISFCFAALIELTFLRQWVVLLLFIFLGVISKLSLPRDFINERQV